MRPPESPRPRVFGAADELLIKGRRPSIDCGPAGTASASFPPKVTFLSEPGAALRPAAASPTVTAVRANGVSPYSFENRRSKRRSASDLS